MKRLSQLSVFCAATLAAFSASARLLPELSTTAPERHTLSVGAGLIGFFSGGAPGTGGSWDLRYAYTPLPLLSVEAGYVGGAADALGPGANIATILEGGLRINPLRYRGPIGQRINPYFVTGLGWGAFSGTSGSPSKNATFEIPFGAGADIRITERFSTGGRFTYRLTTGELGPQKADLDNWQLMARVNAQF